MEATTGIEPVIKALQASALPLGHVASQMRLLKRADVKAGSLSINGAEDGTRTRDPNLGKVMLYQLSHFRAAREYYTRVPKAMQALF